MFKFYFLLIDYLIHINNGYKEWWVDGHHKDKDA